MTVDHSPSARRPAYNDAAEAAPGVSPVVGCLLAAALSLMGVALIFAVGTLVTSGELRLGQNETIGARLWLVNDDDNQGLAWSTGRIVREQGAEVCVQTEVRFLLWRSDGSQQDLSYCDCYTRADQQLIYEGICSDED